MRGKPVAAGFTEPDDDVWEELGEEWQRFLTDLETVREGRPRPLLNLNARHGRREVNSEQSR